MKHGVPQAIEADLAAARRLEWWTLFWMSTVIAAMAATMGSSAAMRTALFEDGLGLLPAAVFLIADRFERRGAEQKFQYGYFRAHSLAFAIAASALVAIGGILLVRSGLSLLRAEHPSIPMVHLLGRDVWLGWLMVIALAYSMIPQIILGRLKQPVAKRLHDKVLYTDALMQKADWTTGIAGIAGILGIAVGWWWADAAAALLISFEILRDGLRQLRIATAELVDGVPRELDSNAIAADAAALEQVLRNEFPNAKIRLRETGRYILAHVEGASLTPSLRPLETYWPGREDTAWRLAGISFDPAAETAAMCRPGDYQGGKPNEYCAGNQ